jgi:hypothetical protein
MMHHDGPFRRVSRIDYTKNNNQTNSIMVLNYTIHGGKFDV